MMTNEEIIDKRMCQCCNQRRECINDARNRCPDYEDAIEILKEKDLQGALTWKDIRRIVEIADVMIDEEVNGKIDHLSTQESYYTEILRRFNTDKSKNIKVK